MKLTEDPCKQCEMLEKRDLYFAQIRDSFQEERQMFHRTLYEIAPVGLYRTRIKDDILLDCNQSFVQLLGYTDKKECLNQRSFVRTHLNSDDRNHFSSLLMEKKKIEGFQTKIRPNGSIIWLEITAKLFPEQGHIEGSVRDISVAKLLSPAEKKVLGILLEGKSNSEIAFALKRSVRTIEDHRSRIMRKLGVENLIELTKKALCQADRKSKHYVF